MGREDSQEITNCATQTCDNRTCPERRICVEEVSPVSCPEDKPICRQYMHAVCELTPKPRPPSDCSVVECGSGMECTLEESRTGPIARCVESRPTNCEELGRCDEGMECHFRPRDNLYSIVRCVPVRTKPRRPRDCSELMCNDGFTCLLFGAEGRQRARCVRRRPQPQSCQDLNCEAVGMLCSEKGRRPICRMPLDCDEVTCPDSHACAIVGIADIPLNFRCPFNENLCKLMIMSKLEGDRILTCLDQTLTLDSCDEFDCSSDGVCAEKVIQKDSSTISACIPKDQISSVSPIATCDSVPEDFCPENEGCVDFQQGDYRGFAHCSRINCEMSGCTDAEDTCVVSSTQFQEETGISHSCAPVDRVLLEGGTTCTGGRTACPGSTNCTDVRISNVQSGTACIGPFQLPPRSCDMLSCKEDEECALDVLNGQVIQASCEPSAFIETLLGALTALDL